MPQAIAECLDVLKPGGVLLFRDYGLYDMTMLRFLPNQRIGFREYMRSDGTRSYFFYLDTILEWTLDDIRGFVKDIVDMEIEKHASDGLGMVDYALASGGGMILDHSERFQVTKGPGWLPFKKQYGVDQDAHRVLEPSFGEPGKCFPLHGSKGYMVIMLRTTIIPEAVTVEHVSKSVAYDRSSAPKNFWVSGWYQKIETITGVGAGVSRLGEKKMFKLTEFVYDLGRSNAQTFSVESGEKRIINMIRLL